MSGIQKILLLKPSRTILALKLLKKALWDYKFQILVLALLGFLSGLLEGIGINALIPLFSFIVKSEYGISTDFITNTIHKFFTFLHIQYSIFFLILFIALLFIVKAIILFFANYINIRITANYEQSLRSALFKETMETTWPYLLKQKIGYLEKVLMSDIGTCADLLNNISSAILLITSLTMYVVVALNISVLITLITLSFGGFLFLFYKPLVFKTRIYSKSQSNLNKIAANLVDETMIGAKTIKSSAVENDIVKKANSLFKEFQFSKTKLALFSRLLNNFNQPIAIIFICVTFLFSYNLPTFNIASFMVIIYLIQKIFSFIEAAQAKLQSVNELVPYIQSTVAYKEAAQEFKEIDTGNEHFSFHKTIEFKSVTFSYNENKTILDRVNFAIKKGEMAGLIGPSGAGKTTIVDLFLRLFNVSTGEILVDGKNIQNIKLGEWRRNIGYVSQDIFLLNDTIENNIKFYDESITSSEIEKAAKISYIYDFIQEQPQKFETVVGDRGVMISAGQRQRIILARVLARNPQILILDEATSALDNESELRIQNAINNLRGKITVFVIAHRLSTVMNSDTIFVLSNGKIIEQGMPEKLLANKDSYFYKTYNIK